MAVAGGDLEEERGREAGRVEEVEVGEDDLGGVEEEREVLVEGRGDSGFREAVAAKEDEDGISVGGGGRGADTNAAQAAMEGEGPLEEAARANEEVEKKAPPLPTAKATTLSLSPSLVAYASKVREGGMVDTCTRLDRTICLGPNGLRGIMVISGSVKCEDELQNRKWWKMANNQVKYER